MSKLINQLSFALLCSNIKASYYAAAQHPTLYECGFNWYVDANNTAKRIAARCGVSLECSIGVIAAISPHNPWERSLLNAESLIRAVQAGKKTEDIRITTFNGNKEKAIAIALGTTPLSMLSGPKTRCFYTNILNPDDDYTVTVDGHACHAALGVLASLDSAPSLSDKSYKILANAYRQACTEINTDSLEANILPCQLQAVVWCYYRVLRGLDKSFTIE